VFYNSVFLLLPDEALTFAGGYYKINGIIGIPQMRLVNAITLKNKSEMVFHKNLSGNSSKNLAFDGLTPVFMMTKGNDTLSFTFDTGGQKSILYKKYLDLYKKTVEGKYELIDVEVGGAGGSKKIKGYNLDKVSFASGTSNIELTNVNLLAESMKKKDNVIFGNLGLDMIWQFKVITINFKEMSINLSN